MLPLYQIDLIRKRRVVCRVLELEIQAINFFALSTSTPRAIMARLTRRRSTNGGESDEISSRPSTRLHTPNPGYQDSPSSSPGASFSSDKENQTAASRLKSKVDGEQPATNRRLSTTTSTERTSLGNKRRRTGLSERETSSLNQVERGINTQDEVEKMYYDPEQPIEQRRQIRKTYRDLGRQLMGL